MYGPLPYGGLPMEKRTKLKVSYGELRKGRAPETPTIEEDGKMKLNQMAAAAAISIAGALSACDANHDATATKTGASLKNTVANPSTSQAALRNEGKPSLTSPSGTNGVNFDTQAELASFIEPGMQLRDVTRGDINNDALPDAVIILESASDRKKPRSVLLLARNESGALNKLARNDKLVSCFNCGGTFGDPFSYTQIANSTVTIVTEGGSREHWWNEYTFTYSGELKDLMLSKVTRGVTDSATGDKKEGHYTTKDFGSIKFEDFDPSKLPEAGLP